MLTTKNCIYMAQSKINGKMYIGKTQAMLQERIRNHKRDSRRKKNASKFYNHTNKYGWDDIEWSILFSLENQNAPTEKEKLLLCQKEDEYITLYDAINSGFNIMRGGIYRKGGDWRKRNSEYMKKKWRNPEYRQQMNDMLNSDEHKKKIRQTRRLNGNVAKPKTKIKKVKPPKNIVYKATSKATGLIYIGASTVGIVQQRNRHKRQSKKYNSKFYKHIQQYGIDDLIYETLYVFPLQENLASENKVELRNIAKRYIKEYDTENNGLNTAPNDITEETREIIRQSTINRWTDEKFRNAIVNANIGKKYPNRKRPIAARIKKTKEERAEDSRLRGMAKRRARNAKEYKKFTKEEIQPVIDMLQSGLRPRHILAKGVSKELLNKAQREIKK